MRRFRDPLVALAIVLVAGSLAMIASGSNPVAGFGALLFGSFGSIPEIGETLIQTTALLFPALGIALAFRAGLFNIGAEGQLLIGGMCAGVVGAALPGPPLLVIPALLLAGALGGGCWAAIAGALRARFGANEVIATLMLNVLAPLVAAYVIGGPARLPGATANETPGLPDAAILPTIVPHTRLSLAFILALAVAVLLWWVLARSRFGFDVRAVGAAPEAARRAGIAIPRLIFWTITLSGAIAGLGGATLVAGVLHRFNTGISPGYGFIAIAVALVGELDPRWIIVASLVFGVLQNGALTMQAEANVPRDVIAVIEGLVVVALAGRRFLSANATGTQA